MPIPPCVGKHELFDSRDPEDHVEAKRLCDTCPILSSCLELLEDVRKAPSHLGGSPEGTWAGQLIGQAPRVRPGRAPCGSESAYQSHRYYKEDADEACLDAHRKIVQIRARRLREAS
jgi:hypothetical protein